MHERTSHGSPAPTFQALASCADLSLEHADGTTACLDPACELPHALHTFQASCDELGSRCGCLAGGAGGDASVAA